MASYSIIMYLMLLIIYTISTESIDVYSQLTMYSNKTLLVLIELSNIIFVIWMLLLLINKLLDFLETKGIHTKSLIPNIYPNKEIVTIEKEIIKEVPVEKIIYKEKKEELFTKEEYLMMVDILRNKEDYKK